MAAAAVLVSAATWVALGDQWVRFGVLHCIAVAMLVGPLLVPLRWWNVPLGVAVIIAGVWLDERPATDSLGLFVLGVPREGATPVDWYPLMPWLGVMMIGLAAGLALYPAGRRAARGRARLPQPPRRRAPSARPAATRCRSTCVHQPVLIPLIAAALALAGVSWSWSGFE